MKRLIAASIIVLTALTPARADTVGRVTADGLNVRAGPGMQYPVVDGLRQGDRVRIVEREGAWLRIERIGGAGWVHSSYVSLTEEAAPSDPSAGAWFLGTWIERGEDTASGAFEGTVEVTRGSDGRLGVEWRHVAGTVETTGTAEARESGGRLVFDVTHDPRGFVGVLADEAAGNPARETWTRLADGTVTVRLDAANGRSLRSGTAIRIDRNDTGFWVRAHTAIGEGRAISAPADGTPYLILGGERVRLRVRGPAGSHPERSQWASDAPAQASGADAVVTLPAAAGDYTLTVDVPFTNGSAARQTIVFRVRDLRPGDRGHDVLMLQERLAMLGYRAPGTDGVFGGKVEARMRDFRSANSLSTSRVVNERAREVIAAHARDYEAALEAFPDSDLDLSNPAMDGFFRDAAARIRNLPAGVIPARNGRTGAERLLRALLVRESGASHWRNRQIEFSRYKSRDVGALGIGQVMPFHSAHYAPYGTLPDSMNLYRPDDNLMAAALILDDALRQGFRSLRVGGESARDALAKALAVYNAGAGYGAYDHPWREIRSGGYLPSETIEYAENILGDLGL